MMDEINDNSKSPQSVGDLQSGLHFLESLRMKWHEVPVSSERVSTRRLAALSDPELLRKWLDECHCTTTDKGFSVRGWYHLTYCDILRGKKVLDVGSGLGIDALTFAQHGAIVTCLDIVEENLMVLKRLSALLQLPSVDFLYMDQIESLSRLPDDYDVIWCQGSMINAPFSFAKIEAQALLKHLPIGGRWVELAYPKARWEREGRLPFTEWGSKTDGEGTPWVEWYDLEKIRSRLAPAEFDIVLTFNFHNDDFNWFDLVRRS
jgi:SAM-dependent methyltransferase